MSTSDIPKIYSPAEAEAKWYPFWEKNGFFRSLPDEREPYAIVIPPPNVTGVLHMGHMLNNTIQDVIIRRARMMGKNACWVPGTDHASIATEAKVVGRLRENGIKKSDLSRDEFLKHAWDWTNEYGDTILKQLRKLGASCDWERTRFTLEDDLYDAVIDCFIHYYEKGHIYRGLRMVNWDPVAKTALSDEEVIHKEVKSKLYYVKYAVQDSDEFVTIATTRPETILADTAVCVNPNDPRYTHLIGKTAIIPMVNRPVPIIADEYVEPEFGTGCLKVTPAHDVNDNELGIKHKLEVIDILNDDATLNETAQFYVGEDRFKARKLIIKDLEEAGQLVKIEDIKNKVGYSERTDAVIEPKLSLQWFLKMQETAKPALENVMNDTIRFFPDKFKNSYRNWMENVHDWCISRQLWWGHQIPAWYYGNGPEDYVIAKTEAEALEKAKAKSGQETISLRQDEDVLDTWFSSWLWPISVFDGFKNPDGEINYYYPTKDLVTAPEIMFFWVARMIMAGYEFRGEKPFSNVYYHGIVRDKQRRKMSKSLGNSPDPIDLMNQFGADGTRVGMLFSAPAGNDLLFDDALCEQGRNFSNKIWNAFRFLAMNMEEGETYEPTTALDPDFLPDQWMSSRLNRTILEMDESFAQFRLNEALQKIYALVWDDFCDWYIELIKPDTFGAKIEKARLERALGIFETLMKLLHPFTPFISEEIWQRIRTRSTEESLIVSSWPAPDASRVDDTIEARFALVQELVSAMRNIRAESGLSPNLELEVLVRTADDETAHMLQSVQGLILKLQKTKKLEIGTSVQKPAQSASTLVKGCELIIPMAEHIDVDKERARLQKEIQRTEGFLKSVKGKLSNEKFVNNAPEAVVAKERAKLSDAEANLSKLRAALSEL
ncbi:valyl-tRNA synthetase [Cyclonatronum proteinivorum]|uniref:Valine--tRNA ligase n=1 Tax=Cyclonatronum proteinivorum TaxID=1457365 RepID=A0A345UM46_9BACT|nr:valine--tRNA ligase [Cyclonatronum proteinivorum]AXJ01548.1 valyl-tRNA synthetase [Cyclonatronum proteinivorum]